MNYIVAVSGGVDSVVLIDMLVNERLQGPTLQRGGKLVVAHFDHGIRPESDADARFVWGLARKYGLPFEVHREELGPQTSEAYARERRYIFLRETAAKYDATIITAHHQDDLIETIAINTIRGTGWRGLAVFGDNSIERPLLGRMKTELYDYALQHSLEWVEDETNQTNAYLRNRLRRLCHQLSTSSARNLKKLWVAQSKLKQDIDREAKRLTKTHSSSRYFYICQPETTALELLGTLTKRQLTRPQLERMLLAIKTARPRSHFESGNGVTVHFSAKDFIVETP